MQTIGFYFAHIGYSLGSVLQRACFLFRNDEIYLKILFRLKTGHSLNLNNPKRFNEKLQWLKLYNHIPVYTDMVDKCQAKMIVEEILGNNYIIPTLGVWDTVEEIDWDSLPQQFVLKTTHGGGGTGVVICHNRDSFDKKKAECRLLKSMKLSAYEGLKEWPYKNVHRRVMAEQYMEDADNHQLIDFKFHCFNGIPKVVLVCQDRYTGKGTSKDFYDMDWNHLDISRELNGNAIVRLEKPTEFDEMVRIATVLSKKMPFVRIDLYLANHKIYFGEYTFFPASGLSNFYPDKWDFVFGKWLKLHK